VTKTELKAELVRALEMALATARAAHEAAVEGATHGEARAENDKDTRGLEQSYVARGQAMRIAELESGLAAVEKCAIDPKDRVALGALVTIEEDGAESQIFVAPAGGGTVIGGAAAIQVVTPPSPLGKALLGKVSGDDVEIRLPNRVRTLSITAID